MFEFEIKISLFVAPVLEAEQAGEPKAVKRGSWLLIRSQDQNWYWLWYDQLSDHYQLLSLSINIVTIINWYCYDKISCHK